MTYNWVVKLLIYAIGYSISLLGSYFIVRPIVKSLWWELGPEKDSHEFQGSHQPKLAGTRIGILEAILYTTAWLVGKPEFIAAWLAFKIAGQWGTWKEREEKIPPKASYYTFIIGNGFSVLAASTGAWFIKLAIFKNIKLAILITLFFSLFSVGYLCWCCYIRCSTNKK